MPRMIESYSRGTLLIKSATRRGISHLVDFEGDGIDAIVCTCESFILGHLRPCKHMVSVTIPLV